jgi:2-phosphosulfolactate phosphatase
MNTLDAYLLPALVTDEELAGRTVVVIDVLRATTTIATALANGAREVIPCLEVDDARQAAATHADGECLLGGERGGLPIAGFHMGNSPSEYSRERVLCRTIVFTTTNGTRAMMRCRQARRVLLAGFVNAGAVLAALTDHPNLALLCAGTAGQITREDTLLAGYLVEQLASRQAYDLNDQARIARDAWITVARRDSLATALRDSRGGQNLAHIGLGADIVSSAQIDRLALVPELDLEKWSIRPLMAH